MQNLEIYNIDVSRTFFNTFLFLKERYTSNALKTTKEFVSIVRQDTGLDIVVKNSWCNRTEYQGADNTFPWHDHTGEGFAEAAHNQEGTHSGILWLAGDIDAGGSLEVMTDENIRSIDFEIGKFIVIKNDIFHKVSHYYGKNPRVSLIVAFESKEND